MVRRTPRVKAIITTLDNCSMLEQQVSILQCEPLSEIIVVNNGSEDGTTEWLATQTGLTVIDRQNNGAGPGRNAGLDAAGEFDFILVLDGGIRPLRGGIAGMLSYMLSHPNVDVLSPEVATCYTTDPQLAHRRFTRIEHTFRQYALSGTAYALCKSTAWDNLRFSEEGPFGQPGWGVDDNEMACRWWEADILHLDFTGVKLYRRASGSFNRLYRETGIWPNQYGSVYEQRNVLLAQTYPQYFDPIWLKTNLQVSHVLVSQDDYPDFIYHIKALHDSLKDVPHEIIVVNNASSDRTAWWLDTFALRWPHGDTTIDAETNIILHRATYDESLWTGNAIRVDLPTMVSHTEAQAIGVAMAKGAQVKVDEGGES